MKLRWNLFICAIAVLVCLLSLASCNASDDVLIGGDPLSRDKVAFPAGPWSPEDITENHDYDGDRDLGMVSEGRLYFHHSKTEALLVDSKGSLTWLYSDNKDIFAPFDTGDYVRVGHGMIMESYPGQTYISQIALIEDGDVNSFTDEEWGRLSEVFVGGLER